MLQPKVAWRGRLLMLALHLEELDAWTVGDAQHSHGDETGARGEIELPLEWSNCLNQGTSSPRGAPELGTTQWSGEVVVQNAVRWITVMVGLGS